MSKVNTIGFFGDSFCATVDYPNKDNEQHCTYIKKLADHYNSRIVHTGHGGSSVYDLFLIQLQPFLNYTIPDVCIIVWTGPDRLFHRTIRNINYRSAINDNDLTRYFFKEKTLETETVWNAASEYYKHLMDFEVAELQYVSFLKYIDDVILPTIADKTKIIHMFSFGKNLLNKETYHTFKTGVQINPPLVVLSQAEYNSEQDDHRPNHFEGTYKNQLLFETIKEAIDNYEHGKVVTYTIDNEKVKNEQTTI